MFSSCMWCPLSVLLFLTYFTCSLSPHVPCLPLSSRFLIPCSSLVSAHSGRFFAVHPSQFPRCSRKPSILSAQCFPFPITRGLRYYFFMLCYFEARSRPFLLLCTPKGPLCFRYHQSTVNLDFPLLALYILILSINPSMLFSFLSRLSSFSFPRLSTLQIVLILLYQL
jgi:hypothetical protein